MSLIYVLLVWLCFPICLFTSGEIQTLVIGIQGGILIGQIVHLIIVIYDNRTFKKHLKEMRSNDKSIF